MNELPPNRTILFIGDKVGKLKNVSFAFQQAGFSVLWSVTGNEAINVARSERPDLIVAETRLPDISGAALCRMIRDMLETRETPFVVVDEANDSRTVFEALEAGANDLFHPNVDPVRFVEKVVWLIGRVGSADHRKGRRGIRRFRHGHLKRSRTAPINYAEYK